MKKIIYTGAFRFPNGDAAAHRVLSIGRIYKELGHEVIFGSWGNSSKPLDLKQNFSLHEGFQYVTLNELDKPSNRGRIKKVTDFLNVGANTLNWLTEYIKTNKVDEIVVYNPPFLFLRRIASFCKKHNIKLIGDCTEWYDASHLPGGKYGIVALDNYLRMNFGYPQINNIIVISQFLKSFYDAKSCHTIKIPPLIDSDVPEPKLKDNATIEFIYAGSPGKKDNIKDIVNSIQKNVALSGVNFNVVGLTKEQFCSKCPQITVNNNVRFYGRVKHEIIKDFYAKADFSIIIRPQLRYANAGFPTKFVESLFFGVPVITTNTSDLGDYVIDGKNGFLLLSDTEEAITSILLKVAGLPKSEIDKMKVEAAALASKFYYKNFVNAFKKFNEELV